MLSISIFLIGQSLQCIQCGNMENNFQCNDSDTGISTKCSSETTYCQNITSNRFTFKSCGIMDFGDEIDGQNECILDFVRNSRQKIINYILSLHYGIPGCGVFKGGIQNQKGFWIKINCIQMKLPNFENWSNGELSKSTKI